MSYLHVHSIEFLILLKPYRPVYYLGILYYLEIPLSSVRYKILIALAPSHQSPYLAACHALCHHKLASNQRTLALQANKHQVLINSTEASMFLHLLTLPPPPRPGNGS